MSNIPLPWSYVYRYPDGALRMSGGCEVNGSKPVEAIGVYLAPTLESAEARVRELEAELAEAYERCAKVAEEMPNMIAIGPKHVRGLRGSDVATAIRKLAREVKHEAE